MSDPITVVMGENNGFLGAIVMGALRVSGALLELWGKPLVKGSKGAITVVVGALLVVMGALLELWGRYWSFGGIVTYLKPLPDNGCFGGVISFLFRGRYVR